MENEDQESLEAAPVFDSPQRELDRRQEKEPILEASLVLASQGIKHWVEFDRQFFILSVETDDYDVAHAILKLYVAENSGFNLPESDLSLPPHLHLSTLLHLLIPVSVFFWVGLTPWHPWLTRKGGAEAQGILAGEWWRCFTATTLHAGYEHFLSNMISGFFILNLLQRRCHIGISMFLLTLTAGLTNFCVALLSSHDHFSIGFSTVVFSGLGLLAGMETIRLPRSTLGGLRNSSPLIAAFFLAIMVGIGEHVDIKAHFLGFGFGVAVSPLAFWLEKRSHTLSWKMAGVTIVYLFYVLTWRLALT